MLVSEILRIKGKGNTLFTTTPEGAALDAVKVMVERDIGSLVVMDHGRVAESGTHRELLARRGAYAQMWSLQQQEDAQRARQPEIATSSP